MANLSEVKPGSKLRIEVVVEEVKDDLIRVTLNGQDDWIVREWVEAAEHIPAPKVWAPGQWVKYVEVIPGCTQVDILGCCGHCEDRKVTHRHGMVCEQNGVFVSVYFRGKGMETVNSDDIEPDCAPE